MLNIVGMGIHAGDLSVNGLQVLEQSDCILVKTGESETYTFFKTHTSFAHTTLDALYQSSRSFDTLNRKLVAAVRDKIKNYANVSYVVDGSGYDDVSVMLLLAKFKDVKVYPAAAKWARCARGETGVVARSAQDIVDFGLCDAAQGLPLYIYEVDSPLVAGEVKLALLEAYGAEREVVISTSQGTSRCLLEELDRGKIYDYSTVVLVPCAPLLQRKRFGFSDLWEILQVLRSDKGCPWDKVQTHESIKINAIEEAYEVVEAVDSQDVDKLCEEVGDLLLQPVFHFAIAMDLGEFSLSDAITGLCEKLIFRHSHIFGKDKASNADEALMTWEKNKRIEKNQDTFTRTLMDVPKQFPALLRAEKVQKRAGKANMDFASAHAALVKLREEIDELMNAADDKSRYEEGGDLLFATVNVLRKLGVESETALVSAIEKFIQRFTFVEKAVLLDGKAMTALSEAELDHYWCESKK